MKYFKTSFLAILLSGFLSTSMIAQFDDLYFDPDTDDLYVEYEDDYNDDDYYVDAYEEGYEEGYEDGYDDEYSYATRIRRFRRPVSSFDYFSPVVGGFYDPFYTAGANYWNWRRWNRWNRFNNGFAAYDPFWGFNNGLNININIGNPYYAGLGWNRWNRWNSWNSWGAGWGGGFYGNAWCPTPFNNRNFGYFNRGNGYNNQVVYGNSINRNYRITDSDSRYYGARGTSGTIAGRGTSTKSRRNVSGERTRVKTRTTVANTDGQNRISSRRQAEARTQRRTTKVRNYGNVTSRGSSGNNRVKSTNGNVASSRTRGSQRVTSRQSSNRNSISSNQRSSSRTRINNSSRSSSPRMNTNRSSSNRSSSARSTRSSNRSSSTRSSTRSSSNRSSNTKSSSRSSSRRGG